MHGRVLCNGIFCVYHQQHEPEPNQSMSFGIPTHSPKDQSKIKSAARSSTSNAISVIRIPSLLWHSENRECRFRAEKKKVSEGYIDKWEQGNLLHVPAHSPFKFLRVTQQQFSSMLAIGQRIVPIGICKECKMAKGTIDGTHRIPWNMTTYMDCSMDNIV